MSHWNVLKGNRLAQTNWAEFNANMQERQKRFGRMIEVFSQQE